LQNVWFCKETEEKKRKKVQNWNHIDSTSVHRTVFFLDRSRWAKIFLVTSSQFQCTFAKAVSLDPRASTFQKPWAIESPKESAHWNHQTKSVCTKELEAMKLLLVLERSGKPWRGDSRCTEARWFMMIHDDSWWFMMDPETHKFIQFPHESRTRIRLWCTCVWTS
jgi:hypothetical protein